MNLYVPTKKELSVSSSAALIGFIILALSIFFTISKTNSIKSLISGTEASLGGMEDTFAIKRELSDLNVEIATLNSFFVNPNEEVKFIEKIEEVARGADVKVELDSVSLGKSETASEIIENLNLDIKFEGSWEEALYFLTALEKMPYAVTLSQIDIQLVGKDAWSGKVHVAALKMKS